MKHFMTIFGIVTDDDLLSAAGLSASFDLEHDTAFFITK
jgi:hypothetical protein